MNQAPITGESMPVAKGPGDQVYAGTINQDGALEFRADRNADETTLARIIHMVETAQTGNQALMKASQQDFDLAILDYRLPDTNGYELRKRLKERKEDMTVVLLTGQVEVLEGDEMEGISKDEILLKPISPDELLKITEKLSQKN